MKKKLRGIDFLRIIALFSVLIYHINPKFLPGGFLGVEVFFVISGYLMMSSLMRKKRKFNIKTFFQTIFKRAKRILPPLIFMVLSLITILVLFNKEKLLSFNKDGLSAITLTSNWKFIFNNVDYFESFNTSPFKHTWYLSVQEQIFIILAFLFMIFNGLSRRNKDKKRNLTILIILLMAGSLYSLISRFDLENITRVYYGTDTRAFEILFGALLYLYFPIEKIKSLNKKHGLFFSFSGIISLVLFIYLTFKINEFSLWLYYGGFLLIDILVGIMIITLGDSFRKIFGNIIVEYISNISYSAYLWHFPILILTQSDSEILGPNKLYTFIRVIVIFLLAIFTYEFIEKPIIRKSIREHLVNYLNILIGGRGFAKIINILPILILIFGILGFTGFSMPVLSTITTANKEKPFYEKVDNQFIAGNKYIDQYLKNKKEEEKIKEEEEKKKKSYNKLIMIGDSITRGISEEVSENIFPNSIIDGQISRQLYQAVEIAEQYKEYDSSNTAVIFQLGTNGFFTEDQMEELIKVFPKSDKYFLTVFVNQNWEKPVNDLLISTANKYENVYIIDWYNYIKDNEEYLEPDQTHVTYKGSEVLLQFIKDNLKKQYVVN